MSTSTQSPKSTKRIAWVRRYLTHRPACFVGIDIGVDQVRVAALGLTNTLGAKNRLRWKSKFCFGSHSLGDNEPSSQWIDLTVDSLLQRLPRSVDGETHATAISLPISWTLYQTIAACDLPDAKAESNDVFLNSIFQSTAHSAHWPIAPLADRPATPDDQFVVASVSEKLACRLIDAITDLGYRVQCILPHGIALADSLLPLTRVNSDCVVLLERTGSMVTLRNHGVTGLSRVLPELPDEILASGSQLASSSDLPRLDSLTGWLQSVAREIHATTRFARRLPYSLPNNSPAEQPVVLCGELADVPKLVERLAEYLGRPVCSWRYAGMSRPTPCSRVSSKTISGLDDARYATAVSLAYAASQCSSGGYVR
ncbi:hypothetical protein [Stieleria varia]|uniref:Competence protein A n=1 Tax=Stieleria varia TaxID=2528005 RepID=A0A5C6A363_9BACT|nr:hypothetical protein [Stieleria varia]TWT93979.1 hypothetical protein Pla52n_58080 [Stieleria varia]